MKTIVVGYDESEAAQRALARAAELAAAFRRQGDRHQRRPPARLQVGAAAGRGVGRLVPVDPPELQVRSRSAR